MRGRIILALTAAAGLAACASNDKVLFVTESSFGVNFAATPPTASIGYDRNEGYIGPRYGNGAMPPVLSSLETGGGLFNPKVRQLYATGQAAELAAAPDMKVEPLPLKSQKAKKLAVFGTTTSLGLKVSFTPDAPLPDSFSFGYKRKELSYIPLGSATKTVTVSGRPETVEVDIYPSVLAVIDSTIATDPQIKATGLTLRQFFATGGPAEALAKREADALTAVADQAVWQVSAEARDLSLKTAASGAGVEGLVIRNGQIDRAKLACLTGAYNAAYDPDIPDAVRDRLQPNSLRDFVQASPTRAERLGKLVAGCS